MSTLRWVFDPIRPSGARHGGLATAHVITPDLDNFVREVIQNSLDQRIGEDAVTVRFSLHQFTGERKEKFLDALNWDELEAHMAGAAEKGGVTIGPQLKQALENVDNGELVVLRIDDSGTRGLTGEESNPSGNFNLLCRNVLVTSEESGIRGGSFGLGKSVLWRFSMLSTVLFSSRISADPRPGFRLFGRTELPFHTAVDKGWDGPGWFGEEKSVGEGQKRAESIWDESAESTARNLGLFRPIQERTGASILVVGFFEPRREDRRDLNDIARDLLSSSSKWFWPSLVGTPPSLRVLVEAYDNGSEILKQAGKETEEVRPFVLAKSASSLTEKVSNPGEVAEQEFNFLIPGKKPKDGEPAIPPVEARFTLRLRFAGTEDRELQNTVAMMRGAGMVVRYRESKKTFGDQPYHAVLYGGLARGETPNDSALETFLRAAEPPSHNEWIAGTDRLRAEYQQGAAARLTELWKKLDEAIMELCEEALSPTNAGPRKLAELFPISGKGPPPLTEGFKTSDLTASLEEDAWHFSGRIKCTSKKVPGWIFSVGIGPKGETGTGEYMEIEEFTLPGRIELPYRKAKKWHCNILEGVREVVFEGKTTRGDGVIKAADFKRTTVRLEVRAHKEEPT